MSVRKSEHKSISVFGNLNTQEGDVNKYLLIESDDGKELQKIKIDKEDSSLILLNNKRVFSKMFHSIKPKYSSRTYFSYFCELCYLLEVNTNRIVYLKRGCENIGLTLQMIVEELGIGRTATSQFINESIRRGYIARSTIYQNENNYYVNPVYTLNGKGASPFLYTMFGKEPQFRKSLSERDHQIIRKYVKVLDVETS
ncbi:MAG: hypothetical protein H8D45_10990 [Bacteroidetes bacterium]|nr:hypothetical protein [Bacteroidota bacterium]